MAEQSFSIDFSKVHVHEWEEAYYLDFEADIGMQAFSKLLINQETTLKGLESELRAVIESQTEGMDEELRSSYESQIFYHEEMTILELKRQQRYGLCVSLFSFCEGLMKKMCARIEGTFPFRIAINDLNRNEDLMLYWNYLVKVFEIDKIQVEPSFTPIRHQKIVRNAIAHQGGRITPEQAKKVQVVTGIKLTKYGDEYEIELEGVYLTYLIDLMKNFFQKLSKAVDSAYKSHKSPK